MYNHFTLSLKYLRYYLTAFNGKGHGMHSPFVFNLVTKVMNDKIVYPAYEQVEALRRNLLRDQTLLEIEDMGAGSGVSKTNQRTVASTAKHAAKPKKFGQLLYRMVKYYQPRTIIELGTSLGITTSYLSSAKPEAELITMEGARVIATVARNNFDQLQLANITLMEGNFDETLQPVLDQLSSVDFCFVDGNHRQEPTERYFRQLLPKLSNDSILIFDDIHWSREMEQAWHTIQQHETVRCTVDLFFIGIVFFRREFKEKQHFKVRF